MMNGILVKFAATVGVFLAPYGAPNLTPSPNAQDTSTRGEGNDSYLYKYNSAIVRVDSMHGWTGTGFFVNHNGRVVLITAAHVCQHEQILFSERGIHEVLYVEPQRDTCVLTAYQNVHTLKFAGNDPMKGDFIQTTGFPLRLPYDHRVGTADGVTYSFFAFPPGYYASEGTTRMQMTTISPEGLPIIDFIDVPNCPKYTIQAQRESGEPVCGVGVTTIKSWIMVRPGNSGGPLMNIWGHVNGIVIATDHSGAGFIVPLSEVRQVLSRVK